MTPRTEGTQLEGFTIQPGGVLTHRLGTYVSKGVQAERGMIVDKEVRTAGQLGWGGLSPNRCK